MPYVDVLPSKGQIFEYWRERLTDIGVLIDWGEPSCWACGYHYNAKYDIKSPHASWQEILDGWEKMPLQRCHIVPRSLGGSDEVQNLFLMCRECHDLAPNTSMPDIFFEWARAQCSWRRETVKLDNAFLSYGIDAGQQVEIAKVVQSESFRAWIKGKSGLHRPQSNYAPVSSRLTPATIIGLAVHFWRQNPSGSE